MDRKYSPTTRRFKLFDILKGRRQPVPLADLANDFGVHEDTIRRDLVSLEVAGYPIDLSYDQQQEGRTLVRMRSDAVIEGPFTRDEALALRTLRQMVLPFRGTYLHDAFEGLEAKVLESLTTRDRAELERSSAWFEVIRDAPLLDLVGKRAVVESLRAGIILRRQVAYVYGERGAEMKGRLELIAMHIAQDSLFVVADDIARDERRRIRWPVSGFVMATVTRGESNAG